MKNYAFSDGKGGEGRTIIILACVHVSNEALASRTSPYWDLTSFLNVKEFLGDVDDPVRRSHAEIVFKYFEDHVMPRIPTFRKGIIHGDFSGQNIIMDKKQGSEHSYQVAGVIDFGNCTENCTIVDLGICLPYIMLENTSPKHFSNAIEFVGPGLSCRLSLDS